MQQGSISFFKIEPCCFVLKFYLIFYFSEYTYATRFYMKNFRIFESSSVRFIKCSNVFVVLFLKARSLLLLVFSSQRVLIILFEAVCSMERSEKNSLKRLSAAEAAARILDMDSESDSESDDNTSQDSERYAS